MIKIYDDYVYRVIELPESLYNKIDEHLSNATQIDISRVKYLLGNLVETKYLSNLLNIRMCELQDTDYFKLILKDQK